MHDYTYFVYILNSSSRRALYVGITNGLVKRTLQHRGSKNEHSFTSRYKAFRLVYYEEFRNVNAAIAREKEIKGWTRAKKNAIVGTMNPKWRDLIHEWEEKFGIEFHLDGRITPRGEGKTQQQPQTQQQTQGPSPPATPSGQDDNV